MAGNRKRNPTLVITCQDSLANQKVAKNGIHRNVHVVVKNTPFNIGLAIINNPSNISADHIDLHCCTVEALVKYDGDVPEEGKIVELLTNKPCEYKFHVSEKKDDEGSLEVRMKVLTSQHEDMLFRLHINILDADKNIIFNVFSEAIKVVSKPDQVRRIKGMKGKKKTQSDVVGETLGRIEKRQKQQAQLLSRLLKENGVDDMSLSLSSSAGSSVSTSSGSSSSTVVNAEPEMDFEKAFSVCLKRFATLPAEERPAKIRKIVHTSNSRDTRNIHEFVDLLGVEGLKRSLHHSVTSVANAMVIDSGSGMQPPRQHFPNSNANLPLSASSKADNLQGPAIPASAAGSEAMQGLSASYGNAIGYFGDFYQDMLDQSLMPDFM